MFLKYIGMFILRCAILLFIAELYFFHKDILVGFVKLPFFHGSLGIRHILWAFLMLGMVTHLIPKVRISMSGRKILRETYSPPIQPYDEGELYKFVTKMNIKAWLVMLCWLCFNAIFAILYLLDIITVAELLLLSFLYYVFDLFCMLVFCPFQTFFMKNRCCVNCRIFDWGHFMIYTPMLAMPSFFSWSLFFMACVVLIRWEVVYAGHPERFWSESNDTLKCTNCTDKMCQIKKPLSDAYTAVKNRIER